MMTMELAATLGKKVVIERVRAERAAKKRVLKTALGCALMMLEQAKQNGVVDYIDIERFCTGIAQNFVDNRLATKSVTGAQRVHAARAALVKRLRVHIRRRMNI